MVLFFIPGDGRAAAAVVVDVVVAVAKGGQLVP